MQDTHLAEHALDSPVWEITITGIEVFYPGETVDSPLVHALIVQDSQRANEWGSVCPISVPGIAERWPGYSPADIKHMIANTSALTTATSSSRASRRLVKHEKVDKATVCSVRVKYNDKHMFLDRKESQWYSLSGEKPVLSTAEILAILSFT
ncbi:hypothetical protein HBH53_257620 [Parastagonospora nodorum]|nr:hypothetical protein HBH53_257620 [Parastagonospora nodorum]KAH3956119.1 hypothetical protein HBH51_254080 [Parastagonospora nodorum]KAH4215372.1 hypothetical protein HBI06_254830 [Parastagonospora nodorum]KAH4223049.1 hypothetical protein HBI05_251660 [Parastagonospora nodorum]KAH4367573.1 hypothetical protein HBH99_251380 [Parastagonospora nodorum]